jgi:hypothetical protein
MKLFLTIIFFINSLIGFCQVDLFFPLKNEFNWATFEKQNNELKARFMENLPEEIEYYKTSEYAFPKLESHLHVIDFNGDGLDDIILDGWSGGEANAIQVFINTGQSFVKILIAYKEVHDIIFDNGKVHRLYIQSGDGEGGDYTVRNQIIRFDYSSTIPKIDHISAMQYMRGGEWSSITPDYPSHYFDNPIKFEVLNDNYNIRFSPLIDDTTQVWIGKERNGNSLGKIKAGSIGYALGEEVDSTGRIWWFVAMNPDTKIDESVFYDDLGRGDEIEIAPYRLGWISSRYVKKVVFCTITGQPKSD